MKLKCHYKCRFCGKTFEEEQELYTDMREYMIAQSLQCNVENPDKRKLSPDEIKWHRCDEYKTGKADLIGLERID